MLKYIFFFLPILLFAQSTESKKSLAILSFRFDTQTERNKEIELNQFIEKEINSLNLYEIIDRNLIDQVIMEESDSLKGCTNISCAIIIGKKLDANKVIDGVVHEEGNGYSFSIQVINIKTSKVEFSESFILTKPEKYKDEFSEFKGHFVTYSKGEKIIKTKSKLPYIWRSMVLPGWGQYEDGRKRKAYFLGGLFLSFGFYYYINLQNFNKAENNYKSVVPLPATAEQDTFLINYVRLQGPRNEYRTAESNVNIALYLLAFTYLYNVFDAAYYSAASENISPNISFKIFNDHPIQSNHRNYYEISYILHY